jgi:hypothetical protein
MHPSANIEPIVERTRSELARALLRIDGKPVNLEDYPMFLAVYDGGFKKTLPLFNMWWKPTF